MTDTKQQIMKAPLRAGGNVMAIIPQDIDQVWRMARMAVIGRMAPKSLVDQKNEEEATAACAIAIMAGAELGMSPLMALRSYAVVNGRPSLWGDGIKAVVRQSGKCEFIRTGGDFTKGWCEAKRSDTGEEKRVEFTWEQAKKAGLDKKTGPWTSGYADVMMERRATFRCLNDLFADVLGGLSDAQDPVPEDGDLVDVTPPKQISAELPDIPDEDGGTELSGEWDKTKDQAAEVLATREILRNAGPPAGDAETAFLKPAIDAALRMTETLGTATGDFYLAGFLERLEDDMANADSAEIVAEVWEAHEVDATLTGPDDLELAEKIRARHLERIERAAAVAAGQDDMFPVDK